MTRSILRALAKIRARDGYNARPLTHAVLTPYRLYAMFHGLLFILPAISHHIDIISDDFENTAHAPTDISPAKP
jgi:hypothetical protein